MQKHLQSLILDTPARAEPLVANAGKLMQLVTHMQAMGNWRIDVQAGKVWWSPRVFEIHGVPPQDEAIDLDAAIRAFHPSDARIVAWLIMNAIEKRVGFSFTLRLRRRDGEMRLVQSAAAVHANGRGAVTTIYGVLNDVTDRFTEKDVAEGRGRLVRSIILHSPNPIAVLDKALRYLEVSPSWVAYFRLPASATLLGLAYAQVMPDQSTETERLCEQALAGRTVHARVSAAGGTGDATGERGAVLFPWRGSSDEIGGVIIMLTAPERFDAEDRTLREIAEMFGQAGANQPNGTGSLPRASRRRGLIW